MAERLRRIPKQLLDYWNKFNSKQKTIIISVACAILLAFILLFYLMGRTSYSVIKVCDTPKEASEVKKLFDSEGIGYRIASDNVTISVDKKKLTDATFVLADNNISSDGVSIDDLLNNSLGTTNSDRTLKLNLYLQNQMRNSIKKMEGIKEAQIYYIPTEDKNSILTKQEDTSASVLLTVTDDFDSRTAETIAKVVASTIGNATADSIKVADQYGNLLYGGEQDLYSGSANSNEDFKERLRNNFMNNLYMGLLKSGYDDVEIMPNLHFNMDKVSQMFTEYLPAEGQDQGLYGKSYTYTAENAGASGGVPGTTSNDQTTDYMTPDTSSSTGNVKSSQIEYLPNQRQTNTEYEVGAIDTAQSSLSILLLHMVPHKQEELQAQGLLEGTNFEEYAAQNSARTKTTVDPDTLTLVSRATGIAEGNIQIVAYDQPVFIPKVPSTRSWTDYLQIIIAVLIIGLLLFVVFRGITPVQVTELEPELSVEQLLATTKENQNIEDIEFNEVSEVRRMIEKFVDEKPEAVAQLMRNWLNEDWS